MRSVLLAVLLTATGTVGSAAEALRERLEAVQKSVPPGFTVLAQPPFVVAGDEPATVVQKRAENIVGWAVSRLKQDFFPRDPAEVIVIWLFKDKASYEAYTWRLYHEVPHTPYGYYSAQHRALIMNIATGGGTLVHEIVHPYMRTNFPRCPTWFNEGLASLFEQSEDRDGHIHGRTNWRLPGLQEAIRRGKTIPFEQLTAMTETEFYGGPQGYNQYYAQSRYLCYYLQEHGLLVKFYREFSAHAADDPTGLQSLKGVLRTDEIHVFQRQWEEYILNLRQS